MTPDERKKAAAKRWRDKNKAYRAKKRREWYLANLDHVRAYDRAKYLAMPTPPEIGRARWAAMTQADRDERNLIRRVKWAAMAREDKDELNRIRRIKYAAAKKKKGAAPAQKETTA